jgi:hypothetical protein
MPETISYAGTLTVTSCWCGIHVAIPSDLYRQARENGKARKRAAAALCPCCNRSFVQLRRHLASQHPDYKGEDPCPNRP